MKMGIDKFLDIFYSILNNDDVYSIDIIDVVEIMKIIFSSDEFKLVSSRLDVNEFSENEVQNHKYTEEIDEDGIIVFEVPEEEREKILDENKVDAGLIQCAINKRGMAKYFVNAFNNTVELRYDNPNGLYNMPYAETPEYKADSKLFTDGCCAKNKKYKSDLNNSSTRSLVLEDATFSLFAYYMDGVIDKIEARGLFNGDYTVMLNEIKRLLAGIEDSFEVEVEDSPKVYVYKLH